MRNFKTEGIIIRRRDFKDTDRIITVLTRDHGKIVIRANGIRKISSRRSPHVELLNHCKLTLYQGNAFPVLLEAQTVENFSIIKEDLTKIGLAYHLCELIDGLCADNQENSAVFELLKNVLTRLSYSSSERNESKSSVIPDLIRNPEDNYLDSRLRGNDNGIVYDFQTELLSQLGYLNKKSFFTEQIDMDRFVENILERRLKSKRIFAKL